MKIVDYKVINEKFKTKKDLLAEDKRFLLELNEIADEINSGAAERPIVLLSGPSGSGKTTTAALLHKLLEKYGRKSKVISLDNYFKSISKSQLTKVDLESPQRVDSKLLSEHIAKIAACKEIELPTFDFLNTKNVKSGEKFKRKPNEIVIFEGIHALNPDVVNYPDEKTFKIYVSVRTRLEIDSYIIHPKYLRLIRRICRDMRYRGRSAEETVKYFPSVERGEELYVAPFKNRADVSLDTFIAYEPKIFRNDVYDFIGESSDDVIINRLKDILSHFEKTDDSIVHKYSLIREFIGEKQ